MKSVRVYRISPDRRGQALVEAVIVLVILLSVLMTIPLIGKLGEIKRKVIEGARYAAWERTVWYDSAPNQTDTSQVAVKSETQIRNEVWARFFADPGRNISDTDKTIGANAGYDPLLNDNLQGGGARRRLINWGGSSPGATTETNSNTPGIFMAIFGPVLSVLGSPVVSWLMGNNSFDLTRQGFYSATVKVPLARAPLLLAMTNMSPDRTAITTRAPTCAQGSEVLCFSGKNVILTETWNAQGRTAVQVNNNDDDQATRRTKALVLTNLLQNPVLGPILNILQTVVSWIAPEWGPNSLVLGHVDMEPIPSDREP